MEVLEIEGPRRKWRRSAQLGIVLIVLGTIALGTILSASAFTVALIGWLLVLTGVAEAVYAFRTRRSDGFLFHLVPGIAAVPIGLLTATHPAAGEVTWMLLFASFFTIVGLFRTISAFWLKFPNWGWTMLEGLVTLIIGSVMWAAWVWVVPWFFGFAVGLSLILRGWSSIMFALGLRRLSRQRRGEAREHEPQRKYRRTSGLAPS